MIKIDFEFIHQIYGSFKDAIHLPNDHNFTENEIENIKIERYNNWINSIESISSSPHVQMTPEPISETITVAGENYVLLNETPPNGAKLLNIDGNWYIRKM